MPRIRMLCPTLLVLVVVLPLLAFCVAGTARADDPLHAGPPILISSLPLNDMVPAAAYNPTGHLFLVVWAKGSGKIVGRYVSEQGEMLYPEFVVNGTFGGAYGIIPAVAYNDSSDTFLVVWSQFAFSPPTHTDIYAQRLPGT
jgi:hypothetical protein